MDSVDYPAYRREALQALIDLNEAANARYGVIAWERFDLDLDAATLTFSHKGKRRVVADIQVIGGTDWDWFWAWAPDGDWPPAVLEDVRKVQAWGEAHGVEELTTPRRAGADMTELGWALAAVAAKITGAVGVYRMMDGPRSLFLLYRSLEDVA